MKNKYLLIIIILAIVVCLIFIIGSIKTSNQYSIGHSNELEYDSEGRVIVHSAEEMKELEPGTPISVAIPNNTSVDSEEIDRQIREEKERLAQDAKARTNTLSQEEIEKLTVDTNQIEKELENKISTFTDEEQELVNIFSKYYPEDNMEDFFRTIKKENYENANSNQFSENTKTFLKKSVDLIKNDKVLKEEKDILFNILKEINLSTLDDKNLLNEIKSLGIDTD